MGTGGLASDPLARPMNRTPGRAPNPHMQPTALQL